MISNDSAVLIFVLGFLLLLVFRFYTGKYRFTFLMGGILLLVLRFSMDKVTILENNKTKEDFYTFKKSIEFNFSNGRTLIVPVGSNTFINNTSGKYVIEKVQYGSTPTFGIGDVFIQNVMPYSGCQLESGIDYYFEDPPKQISVKRGGSTIRYWLH